MVNFDLDDEVQSQLEATVKKIITRVNRHIRLYGDTATITEKGRGDEQIDLDVIANEIIKKDYRGVNIFTEESLDGFLGSELIVADPIDGSSEINRMGPYSNPLSTSIMLISNNHVIAAASGDIWKGYVYGIDEKGLYMFQIGVHDFIKEYIFTSQDALDDQSIRLAAYARNCKRAKIAKAIDELLSSGVIEYFGNDGGGMFPIQVALSRRKGYNCAAELLPKELYEHITEIMATKAGAKLSRLDDTLLEIDPTRKQTSIIAVNDRIRKTLINKLKETYEVLNISHVEVFANNP